MSSKIEIAEKYIEFLHAGEIDAIISLFAPNAEVDSPLYGLMKAPEFFNMLKADTTESTLTTHGIFEKAASNEIALYFNYLWHLKNGTSVKFDVVDIMKFDDNTKITHLKIIYDTVKARPLLAQQKP